MGITNFDSIGIGAGTTLKPAIVATKRTAGSGVNVDLLGTTTPVALTILDVQCISHDTANGNVQLVGSTSGTRAYIVKGSTNAVTGTTAFTASVAAGETLNIVGFGTATSTVVVTFQAA